MEQVCEQIFNNYIDIFETSLYVIIDQELGPSNQVYQRF